MCFFILINCVFGLKVYVFIKLKVIAYDLKEGSNLENFLILIRFFFIIY